MNLLTETLDYMKELGKTPDDVLYVKMTKDSGFGTNLTRITLTKFLLILMLLHQLLTTNTIMVMVLARLIRVRQSCLRTTQ